MAHVGEAEAGSAAAVASPTPVQVDQPASSSNTAQQVHTGAQAKLPPTNRGPSSVLLQRVADGRLNSKQLRQIAWHLLRAHAALPADLAEQYSDVAAAAELPGLNDIPNGSTVTPPSNTPPSPTSSTAPTLTCSAYEVLLSALQDRNDARTFELVWQCMLRQEETQTVDKAVVKGAEGVTNEHTVTVARPTTRRLMQPTAIMYLCRMTLQLQQRQLSEVEATFNEWMKKATSTSTTDDQTTPFSDAATAASSRLSPPLLLAYHVLLRGFILRGESNCADRCMQVLQSIKMMHQTAQHETSPQPKSGAGSSPSSLPSSSPSHPRPTHVTFNLLLESCLVNSRVDLISPILLEMEHGVGHDPITPDWSTLHLALNVCRKAIKMATEDETKAAGQVESSGSSTASTARFKSQQALARANEAWSVAEDLWKRVASLNKRLYGEAVKRHTEQLRLAKVTAARTGTEAKMPPPPFGSLIPAALYTTYLDLAPSRNKPLLAFDLYTEMHRDAHVLPSRSLCERLLDTCVAVCHRAVPPLHLPDKMTEKEREETTEVWQKTNKHLWALQDQAADVALQMLRCINTHDMQEQQRKQAIQQKKDDTPTTPTQREGTLKPEGESASASEQDASDSAASTSPSSSSSPVTTPSPPSSSSLNLSHYLRVFDVQSRMGRTDEFLKLWQHFMAQPPNMDPLSSTPSPSDSVQPSSPSPSSITTLEALEQLLECAVRLDSIEITRRARSIADSEDEPLPEDELGEPTTGGMLAYSICSFFAKRNASATASTPPTSSQPIDSADSAASTLAPVIGSLSASTFESLLRVLLGSDMIEECRAVLEARGSDSLGSAETLDDDDMKIDPEIGERADGKPPTQHSNADAAKPKHPSTPRKQAKKDTEG